MMQVNSEKKIWLEHEDGSTVSSVDRVPDS